MTKRKILTLIFALLTYGLMSAQTGGDGSRVMKQKGFAGFAQIGVNEWILEHGPAFDMQLVNGYQFNEHSFAGAGLGVDGYFLVYADYRHTFYCKRSKIRPFLEGRFGLAYDHSDTGIVGDYLAAGGGIEIPLTSKLALQFYGTLAGSGNLADFGLKTGIGICF